MWVNKQNLNVKTFGGNSLNTVKSQIFAALIAYLLLELTLRVKTKRKNAFSNFVENIFTFLCFYISLDFVILHGQPRAIGVTLKQRKLEFFDILF